MSSVPNPAFAELDRLIGEEREALRADVEAKAGIEARIAARLRCLRALQLRLEDVLGVSRAPHCAMPAPPRPAPVPRPERSPSELAGALPLVVYGVEVPTRMEEAAKRIVAMAEANARLGVSREIYDKHVGRHRWRALLYGAAYERVAGRAPPKRRVPDEVREVGGLAESAWGKLAVLREPVDEKRLRTLTRSRRAELGEALDRLSAMGFARRVGDASWQATGNGIRGAGSR